MCVDYNITEYFRFPEGFTRKWNKQVNVQIKY